MTRMTTVRLVAVAVVFEVAVFLASRGDEVVSAVIEYVRPTTVEGDMRPPGCVVSAELAPKGLMEIVQAQASIHRLEIQRTAVCSYTRRLPWFEGRPKTIAENLKESQCRPLYGGCCSCQFGRHVLVVAAEGRDSGSVLVQANLIQPRGEYLRSKLVRVRRSWLFWAGNALLLTAFLSVLFMKGVVWVVRRLMRRTG